MTEKQIRSQLKKDLKGKITIAAEAAGVSQSTLSRFLEGKQKNDEILEKLVIVRNTFNAIENDRLKKLKKQVEQ